MTKAAILDVDGTLVDTNYHHALAWHRAFRLHEVVLPVWRIHRHMGMGGDQLIAAVAGRDVEQRLGDSIRATEKKMYAELIDEVEPMEDARALIVDLKERETAVVFASSAKQEEVDHYLDLLDARDLVDAWTTSADVETTKPHPDLIESALSKVSARDGVMIGDSTFDCEASGRAGIKCVGVLTGGFSVEELRDAGAARVFESLGDLRSSLEEIGL